MRINNKLKQFFSGTWGSKEGKEHKITEQDFQKIEEPNLILKPRQSSKHKYRKKKKKPYIYEGNLCPFCKEELPYKEKTDHLPLWKKWFHKRVEECKCGAVKMKKSCPACRRDIWYKGGIYMHQINGCGFKGRKKV